MYHSWGKTNMTHPIDVICEFDPLIIIESMTDIRVRALDSNLGTLLRKRCLVLCPQLHIQLRVWQALALSRILTRSVVYARTHFDPILKLNLAAGVDADVLERLACDVVRLS